MSGRLPNLLIAGVPKAGTSSLFSYLGQHPDVCTATTKEVRYFAPLMEQGGTLPPPATFARYFAHCGEQRYALEATPSYCYGGERVLRAIDETLPDPRIIIILRDPVDRLVSAYRFQQGRENLDGIRSFPEYVAACEHVYRRTNGVAPGQGHLKGLSIGFYGDYVPQWLDTFADRVRIVFFEDLTSNPLGPVGDLCRWLTIDDRAAGSFDYAIRNKTVTPRSATFARMVFGAKRKLDAVVPRGSVVRRSLRAGYRNVNSRRDASERIDPAARRDVAELYRDSNRIVADALRARGHGALPDWLSTGREAPGPSHGSAMPAT